MAVKNPNKTQITNLITLHDHYGFRAFTTSQACEAIKGDLTDLNMSSTRKRLRLMSQHMLLSRLCERGKVTWKVEVVPPREMNGLAFKVYRLMMDGEERTIKQMAEILRVTQDPIRRAISEWLETDRDPLIISVDFIQNIHGGMPSAIYQETGAALAGLEAA